MATVLPGRITLSSPLAQYESQRSEIDAAIATVLARGRYVLGAETEAFEAEFASFIGATHGIGVGSGTEALHLALKACGVGPGDEVVTVSHTAVATVSAIELCGALPVFVDIDPGTFTMDAGLLGDAVTPRTRAVVPVHLYGQPAELGPIMAVARRHGVRVIEDCAQAHGALCGERRAGSFGDLSCFSFYPTKNLGAIGDGGMVLTSDAELATAVRMLREYGWEQRYVSARPGWNSRLDEMQAAILRVKLRRLDADNEMRGRLAARYDERLGGTGVRTPTRRKGATHVFHLYVVRSSRRDELQAHLDRNGIGTLVHYPVPIHLQPAYRGRCGGEGQLPETERTAREVLSLPMYPELPLSHVDRVVACIGEFEGGAA